MPRDEYPFQVTIGAEAVTLRAKGESSMRVGTILGRVTHEAGRVSIYVDRLLHDGGEVDVADGVMLEGATSTIVRLPAPSLPVASSGPR